MDGPASDSDRLEAVRRHAVELLRIADELGATGVCLCGSVARGDDGPESDIDFYVFDFQQPESLDSHARANRLVKEFRRVLDPLKVDVRGIPGWPLGPDHEASMKRDSVDLRTIVTAAT